MAAKRLLVLLCVLFSGHLFAADSEPVMKTKVCNPAETYCAEVTSGNLLTTSAVQSGAWTTGRTWTLLNSTDSVNAVQSGTWTTGRTWTLSNGTDSIAAVQSGTWNITNISGTISLPTGAATSANQSTEITSLQLLDNPIGSVSPGTAGTSSYLNGCVYTSGGISLTNGQQAACQMTSTGAVKTDAAITSTVGSYVDKGSFTYGTDKFNPTGGIYQDTSPGLTAGQVGVSRMTANRALHVNLRDSTGNEFAIASNPLIIAPANSLGSLSFGDVTTAATTAAKIERTTYTEQTANAQRSIKSASASDAAAGTGARTVKITYFDSTGVGPTTETVTMNGTTCVATVSTTIAYIEKMEVITVGSTLSNVGILTLSSNAACGGTTIGTIAATDNQTFWAHHYVAISKTANVTGISVSHNGTTVGSGGVFTLKFIPINASNQVETQISDFVRLYGQSSTFARTYASPIKVLGPGRLVIYITPETGTSTVYRGAIDFYEQ